MLEGLAQRTDGPGGIRRSGSHHARGFSLIY